MSNVTQLRSDMSEAEWQTRVDLAACYRLVDLYGWTDLLGTHLTARVPGEHDSFLINAYGMLFDEITASSLVKVDKDGNKLSESEYDINPAGFVIHSAVHMARPEAGCVMHTHTAAGVAVSSLKDGLQPYTQQALTIYANSSYHDFEGIALNMDERERLAKDLGDRNIMFLRNHGVLTVGKTIAEAWVWMYRAERASRFQLAIQQAGVDITELSQEVIDTTIGQSAHSISKDGYRPIGVKEWPALLRKLKRENPGYDV